MTDEQNQWYWCLKHNAAEPWDGCRAEDRLGEVVRVLVETVEGDTVVGRAAHQGPEVDGATSLVGSPGLAIGDFVDATVIGSVGVDLISRVSK